MQNEIEGYSLFNDVETMEIRTKSRSTVALNIIEDNLHPTGNITEKGVITLQSYLAALPEEDRDVVVLMLLSRLEERGLLIDG